MPHDIPADSVFKNVKANTDNHLTVSPAKSNSCVMETLAGLEATPLLLPETGGQVTCVLLPVDVAHYKAT